MEIDSTTPGASQSQLPSSARVLEQQRQQQQQHQQQNQRFQQHRSSSNSNMLVPPSPSTPSRSDAADDDQYQDVEEDEEDDEDEAEDEFAQITGRSNAASSSRAARRDNVFHDPPQSASGPVPAARAIAASPNPHSALRTRTNTSATLPGATSFSGIHQALAAATSSPAYAGIPPSSSVTSTPAHLSGGALSSVRTASGDAQQIQQGPASRLPAEVLNYILRFVATHPRDLANCLRVNQLWLRCGVELLWHRPTLRTIDAFHSLLRTLQPAGKPFGLKHLPVRINVEHVGSGAGVNGTAGATNRSPDMDDDDDGDEDEDVEDAEPANPSRGSTPQPQYDPASPMDLSEPAPSSSASSTSDQDFSRPSSAAPTNVTEPEQDSVCHRPPTFHYEHFIRRINFAIFSKDVTDDYVRWVAVCDRLERLTVTGCTEVTDASLCAILPHTPNLVAIDLTDVGKITDATLHAIAQNCDKLQGANLSGCGKITSDGVSALAKACKYLRRVKLCKCPLVTDSGIKTLVRSCPFLLELDLLDADGLGDEGVAEMWRTSRHMRELRFAGIRSLTDAAFPDPSGKPPAAAGTTPLSFGSAPSLRVGHALAIPPPLDLSPAPGSGEMSGLQGGRLASAPLAGSDGNGGFASMQSVLAADRRYRSAQNSPSPRGATSAQLGVSDSSAAASSSSLSIADSNGIVSPRHLPHALSQTMLEDGGREDDQAGGMESGSLQQSAGRTPEEGSSSSLQTTGRNVLSQADAKALHEQLVYHQARNLNAVHAAQQGSAARHHHHLHHYHHRHHQHRDQAGVYASASAPGSGTGSRSASHGGVGPIGGASGSRPHAHHRHGDGSGIPSTTDLVNAASSTASPLYRPFATRLFEQLRVVDLTSCAHLTDTAIEGIIANTPRIRNLVLNKCEGLTDRSVTAIARLGKNLHLLHLGHVRRITDRGVTTLARAYQAIFEIATHLPRLRRIGLVKVNNLTDEGIRRLVERHTCLERIHLSYCENITVDAIFRLLTKLHKLTHLSLTGVTSFRNEELQQFCRQPPENYSEQQRANFCVYSGGGVRELRNYLQELQIQFQADVVTLDEAIQLVRQQKEEESRLREVEQARLREMDEREMMHLQAEMGAEQVARSSAAAQQIWEAHQARVAASAGFPAGSNRMYPSGSTGPYPYGPMNPYQHQHNLLYAHQQHHQQQLHQQQHPHQLPQHGPGYQSSFPGPYPTWVTGLTGPQIQQRSAAVMAALSQSHAHAHAHAQAHEHGLAPSPASMAGVGHGIVTGLPAGSGSVNGPSGTPGTPASFSPPPSTGSPGSSSTGGVMRGSGSGSTSDYHRALAASMQNRQMRIAHDQALAAAHIVARHNPRAENTPPIVAQAQAFLASHPYLANLAAAGASGSGSGSRAQTSRSHSPARTTNATAGAAVGSSSTSRTFVTPETAAQGSAPSSTLAVVGNTSAARTSAGTSTQSDGGSRTTNLDTSDAVESRTGQASAAATTQTPGSGGSSEGRL
ncbi:SCF ubiquitin ligase complex subunit [Tilletia horrida]|nr:SCF ubiquitin ligase complex subunit [Tilletia horrida]